MNKAILVGRLTKDTEIKETSNNSKLCQFTIAVDRRFKDKDGNRQADFISCLAWGKNAEFINKYFHKGSRVYVTEVVVDEAEFVESANSSASESPKTTTQEQPDMPFEI